MKSSDWNGIRRTFLVKAFSESSDKPGVRFKIRAGSEEEARETSREVIHDDHGNFERRTAGNYKLLFERQL